MLAFAGRHTCPRTSIVFDYVFREMIDGNDAFYGAAQTRRRLNAVGEPFQFGIPSGPVAPYLAQFGLTLQSHLGPNDLASRYLRGSDGNIAGQPYGFAAIVTARPWGQGA